jgi:hypothetical protein
MKIHRVGVDLAKSVFQVQGVDHQGKPFGKDNYQGTSG